MSNELEAKFGEIIKKVEQMKKSGEVDLSLEEDLSVAVMNLISLEEHFFFTGAKTGNSGFYDFLEEVRSLRKELMAKMIDKEEHQGETWCITKHLLAAAMRLIEVGTKLQTGGKKTEADEIFGRAYRMYSLFWGLRLKLINPSEFKNIAAADRPWTLKDIVKKLVDCCDE